MTEDHAASTPPGLTGSYSVGTGAADTATDNGEHGS
jgi:hypothetical protein